MLHTWENTNSTILQRGMLQERYKGKCIAIQYSSSALTTALKIFYPISIDQFFFFYKHSSDSSSGCNSNNSTIAEYSISPLIQAADVLLCLINLK